MIQFFLMLFSLAFSHHNANATTCNNNNQNPVTVQNDGPSDPGGGTDPGDGTGDDGGPVGGNTGQLPPPFTPPNP
jgi:hypothetical protein